MIVHVTKAQVVGPHSLELWFDDGTHKRVNLRPLLRGEAFQPLLDPAFFRQVRVDPECRTVVWPNGADFAPEALQDLPAEQVQAS